MPFPADLYDVLARNTPGGYGPGAPPATEPTAWATIALAGAAQIALARRGADWLAGIQQRDGSVGVTDDLPTPAWATSLAMLAWSAVSRSDYQTNVDRAVAWALESKGRTSEQKSQIGHNTTLVGWSWAADTHSWLEPTAMFVAALRSVGQGDHPRVREGVQLLVDRLLPSGGANYGNTLVLGQELLAHVQPTGLVLWALSGEPCEDPRLERSIGYLEGALNDKTPTASLAFGVMGLSAQGRRPRNADRLVQAAFEREISRGASPYKLAVLAMAASQEATQLAAADD